MIYVAIATAAIAFVWAVKVCYNAIRRELDAE